MKVVQGSKREQGTNTDECINCDVFTSGFVANVISHVTQLNQFKSPAKTFGILEFRRLL